MQSIKTDTEGGFDAYIDQQREVPKRIEVTLAQFDTEYELVYANRPLAQVPPLRLRAPGHDSAVRRGGAIDHRCGE